MPRPDASRSAVACSPTRRWSANGEGVYPHSFERLGAQRGFHVTAWYYTRDGRDKGSIGVGVQVVCGLGLAPLTAPHATTFTKPGQTKTVTARCPAGQYLLSGGFQRTDFLGPGGNYVTENRAAGAQAWTVTARAYGEFGGELTAIAYCTKASGPLLTEVASEPVPVGWLATATATTAAVPARADHLDRGLQQQRHHGHLVRRGSASTPTRPGPPRASGASRPSTSSRPTATA